MPSAEIITIGTELLLGEIVDTNSRFLAQCLRDAGIDLYRTTTVGDNAGRIAQAIQQSLQRSDIVLTSGGLGPTVDDPTRQAVALSLGVKTEYHPELWDQISTRFRRLGRVPTENNRRQAYLPEGAKAIVNPVGTAPIFIMEYQDKLIISLPGVPSELEYLMIHEVVPFLRQHYDLHGIIKTRVLHTVGVGESQIDDLIGDLEQLNNPTVGLAAHSGQVDVRITAKADSIIDAEGLIKPLESIIRERLGDSVYGADQESLEEISLRPLVDHHWTIAVIEAGLSGKLLRRLASVGGPFLGGQVLVEPPQPQELLNLSEAYRQSIQADVALGVAIFPRDNLFDISLVLVTPSEKQEFVRRYGGPPEYAPVWAINQSLDLIRRISYDS